MLEHSLNLLLILRSGGPRLKETQTYSIHFARAVRDLHENHKAAYLFNHTFRGILNVPSDQESLLRQLVLVVGLLRAVRFGMQGS